MLRLSLALIALLISLIPTPLLGQDSLSSVLIFSTDLNRTTNRTIKGVKQAIFTSGENVSVEVFSPKQGQSEATALSNALSEYKPDILITVGSRSTRIAKSIHPGIPIIFASVLNPVTSGIVDNLEFPGNTVTGASLDISVDLQLQKLAQLVPDLNRVGVLYSEKTKYIVDQAESWAADQEIEIVPFEVKSPRDIPRGIDHLIQNSDGIWAIPDELIYTPQSTKHIMLESFRNRIPIMGFSPSFVKSGALFALIVDHKYVGVQAGELAVKVIKGYQPGELAVTRPQAPYLYINKNTAEKLHLNINPDFYSVAKEVYE